MVERIELFGCEAREVVVHVSVGERADGQGARDLLACVDVVRAACTVEPPSRRHVVHRAADGYVDGLVGGAVVLGERLERELAVTRRWQIALLAVRHFVYVCVYSYAR